MYPNPIDCDAAVARMRDLLLEAQQDRAIRALRGPASAADHPSGRQRLGTLLIRVGRRIEGVEVAPAAPVGAASRA